MLQRQALRRNGARLALLAVAVLLTLSFGHMHADDFFPVTAQSAPHAPGAPLPSHLPPTHDDCAICVTMGMTASSALPAPVVVPVPLAFAPVAFAPPARASLMAAPKPSVRSRGPPSAA
jgi:hypothetical protein